MLKLFVWEKYWPQREPRCPELPSEPIFEVLKKIAQRFPDKTAINFYGREISYRELEESTNKFANALLSLGVKKGDRVAIYMENCPQFVISFYGVLKMGGIVANCSPMYKAHELEHELRDAGIETIVLLDHFYPVLAQIRERCDLKNVIVTRFDDYLPENPTIPIHPTMNIPPVEVPDSLKFMELMNNASPEQPQVDIDLEEDVALFQYTAGTTGLPKGVMLTHKNLTTHSNFVAYWFEFKESDIHLAVLPLFHITGLDCILNPALLTGGTVILFARFDLLACLEVIQKYKVTVWITIAPINVAVVTLPGIEKYDLSSLEFVASGGAPVPVELHAAWKKVTGTEIVEAYGLSESCGGVISNNRSFIRPGTIGIPLYYHDIKLVDVETGEEVPPGKEGELWVKGPCVMKGYWRAEEATKEVLTEDGWLRTGDVAVRDEDGVFKIVGRVKEMIKVSGYSVFLAEVDAFLYQHPAVAEAATIGVPHPYRGEEPKSFIVLKPDYVGKVTPEEIIEWCRDKMAEYKRPRYVEFVDSLPKTGAGKILRRALKEQEMQKRSEAAEA